MCEIDGRGRGEMPESPRSQPPSLGVGRSSRRYLPRRRGGSARCRGLIDGAEIDILGAPDAQRAYRRISGGGLGYARIDARYLGADGAPVSRTGVAFRYLRRGDEDESRVEMLA